MADDLCGVGEKGRALLSRATTFTARVKFQQAPSILPHSEPHDPNEAFEKQSSTTTDDLQGYRSLDPDKTVLLRFECITATELKVSVQTCSLSNLSTRSTDLLAFPTVMDLVKGIIIVCLSTVFRASE